MNVDLVEMIALANSVRRRAHAPYSGFQVGAVVRDGEGRCHAGANVENAAYPEGLCAEAAALARMVAEGGRRVVEVVVLAGGEALCTPCGGCRQKLVEFAGPETPVHVCGPDGLRRSFTLGALMPESFGRANLE